MPLHPNHPAQENPTSGSGGDAPTTPARSSPPSTEGPLRVVLIVAVARGRVIGVGNRLPWHLSPDLRRFKALTMGHPIVMGRKTWDSIGKPLPGRTSIVVTRQPDLAVPDGVHVAGSLDDALRLAADMAGTVFVIGGAQLYAAALAHATEVEATLVDATFDGDAFLPRLGPDWHVAAREDHTAEGAAPEGGPLRFSFVRLTRNRAPDGEPCLACHLAAGGSDTERPDPAPADRGVAGILGDLVRHGTPKTS